MLNVRHESQDVALSTSSSSTSGRVFRHSGQDSGTPNGWLSESGEGGYYMGWEALKKWGDYAIQIEPMAGGVAKFLLWAWCFHTMHQI